MIPVPYFGKIMVKCVAGNLRFAEGVGDVVVRVWTLRRIVKLTT